MSNGGLPVRGPGRGPGRGGGGGGSATRLARQAARGLLDLLLPPQCLACRERTEAAGALCAECWLRLHFIGPPLCTRCGLPFDYEQPGEAVCGQCHRDPPFYSRARAALVYDDASRPLLLGFKHADKTYAAPALARWLHQAGAGLLAEADLIVPVPLYWLRLWRRRYNQAALLAHALGRIGGVPVAADLLVRRRPTRSQGGLSRAARFRNIRGAVAVRPGGAERLAERTVLVVDDVMTTGATLNECARILLNAGAASVDVLTVARALRPMP
ncbi:MAG: ComF family protein [Alphaproteobacteria bacterium]|jgi:ComF family protein|nr:ComF family protein [Alphaproteobacteria bacterium]